ncbi:MAG: hypothetical protein KKH94_04210 [Candidatus Omnitrophica bacterium]|nr:hypothetical protein [Candidatus Omnitrophota bacterium]
MKNNIVSKHEQILKHLMKLRKNNLSLYFVPRKINNKNRFEEGYWFRGNHRYLHLSFWKGTDWKERIHNIGFVVKAEGNSYIELSAQDSDEKAVFMRKIVERLGGFEKLGDKNKWQKCYEGNKYLANLQLFIQETKPIIDSMIQEFKPQGITLIDATFFNEHISKVLEARKAQQKFGLTNKLVRICWNTEGWKYPSGSKGKSTSPKSHEAQHGYGHEEWLFDRSRLIEGYHYAFLDPLRVDSGKHAGKNYDVSLYTINGEKRNFYVGDIHNLSCISKEDAERIHQIYTENGWMKEMAEDIQRSGANSKSFIKNFPEFIFNVKFKFDDVNKLDEMEEISEKDINITTYHFKLLPKKTDFIIDENISDDDDGSLRNEEPRKVVFKTDAEYDPSHSKMQNALKRILDEAYSELYEKVRIEKGRIDIQARTKDGKWHYFEIKTDNPKMCIRTALGQVMEYAYFPDKERADKLIIVGYAKPDEEAIRYLQYVRDRFSIPVTYRALDMVSDSLSEDY